MQDKKIQGNLHGTTLEHILMQLVARYGYGKLAERIPIQCFKNDPSIKSSLTFLRKTAWAREKVEWLFENTKFEPEIYEAIQAEYLEKKKKGKIEKLN
jgi:uncharacterized protein (DUF2132 family)